MFRRVTRNCSALCFRYPKASGYYCCCPTFLSSSSQLGPLGEPQAPLQITGKCVTLPGSKVPHTRAQGESHVV